MDAEATGAAARRWREALAAWAIPPAILDQAPESPWIHPPEMFDVPDFVALTPSHQRAGEALGTEASVLDVGCGGGSAAFALVGPLKSAVGVDHQAEMLTMFAANAERFGVSVATIEGNWPEVSPLAPVCDVVTAHHVVYNVAAITEFLTALTTHARHRVVLEMPMTHPLANMSNAWQHFWGLERPLGPTPDDLLAVVSEMGLLAHLEEWESTPRKTINLERAAHFLRIRLCLPSEREGDVLAFLQSEPHPSVRPLATIWWDVTAA